MSPHSLSDLGFHRRPTSKKTSRFDTSQQANRAMQELFGIGVIRECREIFHDDLVQEIEDMLQNGYMNREECYEYIVQLPEYAALEKRIESVTWQMAHNIAQKGLFRYTIERERYIQKLETKHPQECQAHIKQHPDPFLIVLAQFSSYVDLLVQVPDVGTFSIYKILQQNITRYLSGAMFWMLRHEADAQTNPDTQASYIHATKRIIGRIPTEDIERYSALFSGVPALYEGDKCVRALESQYFYACHTDPYQDTENLQYRFESIKGILYFRVLEEWIDRIQLKNGEGSKTYRIKVYPDQHCNYTAQVKSGMICRFQLLTHAGFDFVDTTLFVEKDKIFFEKSNSPYLLDFYISHTGELFAGYSSLPLARILPSEQYIQLKKEVIELLERYLVNIDLDDGKYFPERLHKDYYTQKTVQDVQINVHDILVGADIHTEDGDTETLTHAIEQRSQTTEDFRYLALMASSEFIALCTRAFGQPRRSKGSHQVFKWNNEHASIPNHGKQVLGRGILRVMLQRFGIDATQLRALLEK